MRQNGIPRENVQIHTLSVLLQREVHILKVRGREDQLRKIGHVSIIKITTIQVDAHYPYPIVWTDITIHSFSKISWFLHGTK